MTTLGLGLVFFVFFGVVGLVLFQLTGTTPFETDSLAAYASAPLLGALGLVCVIETLVVFLPVQQFGFVLLAVLLVGIVLARREIVQAGKRLCKSPGLLLLTVALGVLIAYPVLQKSGLVSVQFANNDIIYYLSSMDWMKEHSLLEPRIYTDLTPYYACAEYMITTTRIGTDVLGCFLMTLCSMEPHQVYFALGIALNLSAIWMALFLVSHCCQLPYKAGLAVAALVGISFNWAQLQAMQYVPQIFGGAAVVGLIGYTICLHTQERRGMLVLEGLTIAGVCSVYCEFASYIFVIYFLGTAIYFVSAQGKTQKIACAVRAVKAGLLGLLLSPYGLYRAVMFNLMLLGNVSDPSAIDPYKGQMIPMELYPSNLFGLAFRSRNPNGGAGIVLAVCLLAAAFFCAGYILLRHRRRQDVYLISIGIFLAVYAVYFRYSHFAYGEYKHVFSYLPLLQTMAYYFIAKTLSCIPKSRLRSAAICGAAAAGGMLFAGNLHTLFVLQPVAVYNCYDDDILTLREEVKTLPEDTVYLVQGDTPAVHRGVYALKDAKVVRSGPSYFDFFTTNPETVNISVRVLQNDMVEDIWSFAEKTPLYRNATFSLYSSQDQLEAKPIGLQMVDGFYGAERSPTGIFRWTSAQDSNIQLINNTEKSVKIQLSFQAMPAPGEDKTIQVYNGDNGLIAEGKTQNRIVCEGQSVEPGEILNIRIHSVEPCTTIGVADTRQFGFAISDLQIALLDENN